MVAYSCDRSPVAVRGEARRVVSCCLVLWLVRVEGAVGGEITGVRAEGDALMLMGVDLCRRRARKGCGATARRCTVDSQLQKERKKTDKPKGGMGGRHAATTQLTGISRDSQLHWRSHSHLEHLECSRQPHIQGRGAKKRTQRAG